MNSSPLSKLEAAGLCQLRQVVFAEQAQEIPGVHDITSEDGLR